MAVSVAAASEPQTYRSMRAATAAMSAAKLIAVSARKPNSMPLAIMARPAPRAIMAGDVSKGAEPQGPSPQSTAVGSGLRARSSHRAGGPLPASCGHALRKGWIDERRRLFIQTVQMHRIVMEFTRIAGPIEGMEVWNASSSAATFVICFESRSGPGFHGDTGYAVSWRPIDQSRSAISVPGSPFATLVEAKDACNAMAAIITRGARVNFDARTVLRKWPSLGNERRSATNGPYFLVEGTLEDCLRQLMAKPPSTRHLYEIHTAPRAPLADAVVPAGVIIELARQRGLDRAT